MPKVVFQIDHLKSLVIITTCFYVKLKLKKKPVNRPDLVKLAYMMNCCLDVTIKRGIVLLVEGCTFTLYSMDIPIPKFIEWQNC